MMLTNAVRADKQSAAVLCLRRLALSSVAYKRRGTRRRGVPLWGPALFAEAPEMKRQPNDQAEQDDRGGDLNPDHTAQLPEHNLEPRAPGLRDLISDGLDRMRHEAQPLANPIRMVDEGSEYQRPCRDHSQKAERVRFGQLTD
jgi:hypothetical protein